MAVVDSRRQETIEIVQISPRIYHLTIGGVLWSEVEWSPKRGMWCIQDAAGHCLTHVEHTHAEERDRKDAIRVATEMIRNGGMPSPEAALAQLHYKQTGVICLPAPSK